MIKVVSSKTRVMRLATLILVVLATGVLGDITINPWDGEATGDVRSEPEAREPKDDPGEVAQEPAAEPELAPRHAKPVKPARPYAAPEKAHQQREAAPPKREVAHPQREVARPRIHQDATPYELHQEQIVCSGPAREWWEALPLRVPDTFRMERMDGDYTLMLTSPISRLLFGTAPADCVSATFEYRSGLDEVRIKQDDDDIGHSAVMYRYLPTPGNGRMRTHRDGLFYSSLDGLTFPLFLKEGDDTSDESYSSMCLGDPAGWTINCFAQDPEFFIEEEHLNMDEWMGCTPFPRYRFNTPMNVCHNPPSRRRLAEKAAPRDQHACRDVQWHFSESSCTEVRAAMESAALAMGIEEVEVTEGGLSAVMEHGRMEVVLTNEHAGCSAVAASRLHEALHREEEEEQETLPNPGSQYCGLHHLAEGMGLKYLESVHIGSCPAFSESACDGLSFPGPPAGPILRSWAEGTEHPAHWSWLKEWCA